VTLSIQQNGVTIATLAGKDFAGGNHFMTWDGLLENGNRAPQGEYDIILQAKAAGDESVGVVPLVKSEVTGVDLEGEGSGILITKAGQISFSSILGVYE
jgi:flagellar hook assembly protein FlgD